MFAFPVPVSGQKVKELSLENEATVEMVCLLVLRNPTAHVNIDVDADEMVQDKRGSSRNLVGCPQDSAKNQVMWELLRNVGVPHVVALCVLLSGGVRQDFQNKVRTVMERAVNERRVAKTR